MNALKNSGRPLPDVNQIEMHPWCTNESIVNWCKENNVAVVGFSLLTRGQKLNHPLLIELAEKYQKTPAQILIGWSLQKNIVTIPKSTRFERIDENVNVFDFMINAVDMDKLDELGKNIKEIYGLQRDLTENDMIEFGPIK